MSSSIRHWIWLSVAPRFRHNLCHARLSIHHAQFLTNEMAGAQKHHNFQVDIFWSFSHHIYLRMPDQNPFEQTAPSKLRSVSSHAQWILFVLSFLIAVFGLKTQLCSTISLPLGSQKTLMLQSLLALSLRSNRLSFPTPIGSECRLLLLSAGPIVFASSIWKMPLLTGMKWLFTHSRPSFCFPLKSSTLRHSTLYTSDDTQANSERKSVDCQRSSIAAGSKFSEMQIFLLFVFNIEI